jgi:hypothetical protein
MASSDDVVITLVLSELQRITRVSNSPGARQAFGAPQNGPGRAASLESLIGSGRISENLDVC